MISIRVTTPKNTPDCSTLFLASNLNRWNPNDDKFRLHKYQDGSYIVNLNLTPGNCLAFKVTRGSWDNVEVDLDGRPIPDRIILIKQSKKHCDLCVENWADIYPEKSNTNSFINSIDAITLHSKLLNEVLEIQVYRPANYSENSDRYPVLYMQDGQNLFDHQTASLNIDWRISESLDQLANQKKHKGAIVVGISSNNLIREETFVPWDWKEGNQLYTGKGKRYLKFIIEELKPIIDNNYRTIPSRNTTGIAGSSLGGLISTYAGLKFPNVFGLVGAFSPSFWVASWLPHSNIFNEIQNSRTTNQNLPKIYLDVGVHETPSSIDGANIMLANTRKAKLKLQDSGYTKDMLRYLEDPEGFHNEGAWRKRFPAAFIWLFNGSVCSGR